MTMIVASSFQGLLLMLQFPVSLVLSLIALVFAFWASKRLHSVVLASLSVLLTVTTAIVEIRYYGVPTLIRAYSDEAFPAPAAFLVLASPILLSIGVFVRGRRAKSNVDIP